MKNTINTRLCNLCKHATYDDSNKAKVTIFCRAKQKELLYGQRILCDNFEKEKNDSKN